MPREELVCAVRVASQPTSMKAPRIRNQLKLSMKLRDLVRVAGFEQPQLNQNESEDAADHMRVGARDEMRCGYRRRSSEKQNYCLGKWPSSSSN